MSNSNVAWPSITFQVDLTPAIDMTFGPRTNTSMSHSLSPDQYQNSADQGNKESANRLTNSVYTGYLPFSIGENHKLKHGDVFTVTGLQANYVRDTYAQGFAPISRAVLKIIG